MLFHLQLYVKNLPKFHHFGSEEISQYQKDFFSVRINVVQYNNPCQAIPIDIIYGIYVLFNNQ